MLQEFGLTGGATHTCNTTYSSSWSVYNSVCSATYAIWPCMLSSFPLCTGVSVFAYLQSVFMGILPRYYV